MALRHMDRGVGRGGEFGEREARRGIVGGRRAGGRHGAGGGARLRAERRADGGDAEQALEEIAPTKARGDHVAQRGIGGGVARRVVLRLAGDGERLGMDFGRIWHGHLGRGKAVAGGRGGGQMIGPARDARAKQKGRPERRPSWERPIEPARIGRTFRRSANPAPDPSKRGGPAARAAPQTE